MSRRMKEPATELGRLIRTKRLSLRCSQKTLAMKIGACTEAISKAESKGVLPWPARLAAMSNILAIRGEEVSRAVQADQSEVDSLGGVVKRTRISLYLSRSELARRCGLSLVTITKIELNKRKFVRKRTVDNLAKALSCEMGAFDRFLPKREKAPYRTTLLGKTITQARVEVNISQHELAKRIGYSRQAVNCLERGLTRRGKQEMVSAIAKTLAIDENMLLEIRKRTPWRPLRARKEEMGEKI